MIQIIGGLGSGEQQGVQAKCAIIPANESSGRINAGEKKHWVVLFGWDKGKHVKRRLTFHISVVESLFFS